MDRNTLLAKIQAAEANGEKAIEWSGLKLTHAPHELFELSSLLTLNVSSNPGLRFPANRLARLSELEMLSVSDCTLEKLPEDISELHRLKWLYARGNDIELLPEELGRLDKLEVLDLSHNRLREITPSLGYLTNLRELRLRHNSGLKVLPAELGRLRQLSSLELDTDTIVDPPPEVVMQGTAAILSYLQGRLQDSLRRWVSKVLFVGEGGAGKTCLIAALKGAKFNPASETTHGIAVESLSLPHPENNETMTLNCWDFGGQQIYHATHQFFLTNRSLFLVIWNARQGFEQGRLYYWLDTVKALAPDSPVLIVATHADERDAVLPKMDLQKKYPQIVAFAEVSNKTGDGVPELADNIANAAVGLPLMGEYWPKTWYSAAQEVALLRSDKQISRTELHAVLAQCGVDVAGRDVLLRWLHELGEVLHFSSDPELRDIVLLDPQWVTEQISRVLEDPRIVHGLGIFRRDHMNDIWSDLPVGMHESFLRLMEKFDLSYRIPDDPENRSLLVERLSLDPPAYQELWDSILGTPGCKQVSMVFDLQSARPAGIPTWFIARSHRFTTSTHWRYGAVFADGPGRKHLALVTTPPSDETIQLSVRGPSPCSFFELLRDGLELTLARFRGLDTRRTVPCPGHVGKPCEHSFDYAHLMRAVERDPPRKTIECPVGFADVNIAALLFGIHWSTEPAVLDRLSGLEERILHGIREAGTANQKHDESIIAEIMSLRELIQRQFMRQFDTAQRLIESHTPRVFAVRPADREGWGKRLTGTPWDLKLYCEAPGHWHPCGSDGTYRIDKPKEWVRALSPYIRRLARVFGFVVPLLGPTLGVVSPDLADTLKRDLKLMETLTKSLPKEQSPVSDIDASRQRVEASGAELRVLRKLLEGLDPQQSWGGLRKVLTPEGHYFWLCEQHAAAYA